jgi:hypothetical protein
MTNFKNEIDAAADKMIAEMVKANFSPEKLEMNKKVLLPVIEGLKADLDKYTITDLKFYGCKDAKTYVASVYGMAGKFADHGSMKHRVASGLSKLM